STGGYVPFGRQLEVFRELIAKLHLGRPILVGHSYGGSLSLAFAERYPSLVRGLVLVDAAATCSRDSAFARAQARLIGVMEAPVIAQLADATFSQLLRKVSAEQADEEAFDPAPVAAAHRHRVLAINMKRGNLETWSHEVLAANG